MLHDMTSGVPLVNEESGSRVEVIHRGASSFSHATFNLMNAIFGSGILGLAYALRWTGMVLFTVLILSFCAMADFSISLLLQCCKKTDLTSYEQLGRAAYGQFGIRITSFAIAVQNIGAMTSYLVVIGDVMPSSIELLLEGHVPAHTLSIITDRKLVMAFMTVVLILPLLVPRQVGFLGPTSFISIMMVFFFLVSVIIRYNTMGCTSKDCTPKAVVIETELFYVLPTMAFSFVCHTALLPVYDDLKDRTTQNMQRVAHTSLGICISLYLVASFVGYMTFIDDTNADLLKSYSAHDYLMLAVRLCFALAVTFTIPVVNFPCRKALMFLLRGENAPFSWVWHVGLAFCIIATVLLMAMFVPSIKVVFGLVGSSSAVTIMFILPGLFWLRIVPNKYDRRTWRHYGSYFIIAVGVTLGVTCSTAIIVLLATG